MHYTEINQGIGNPDLYLLDQILKGRFEGKKRVLDAGCGEGRNMTYFIKNGCDVYGIDNNPLAIRMLHMMYKSIPKQNFMVGDIGSLPWKYGFFDVVICSAVLHFARDQETFDKMMTEMSRVLAPGGLMFIRMATSVGIKNSDDHTFSYLLSYEEALHLPSKYSLEWVEPFKTVVVEQKRSMGTLMLARV